MKKILLLMVVFMGAAGLQAAEPIKRTVTTTGWSSVTAQANQVEARFEVSAEGTRLESIKGSVDGAMNRMLALMAKYKIKEKNYSTVGIRVYSHTPHDRKEKVYHVQRSLKVKLDRMEDFELLAEDMFKAGATAVQDQIYSSSKAEQAQDQARLEAAKDAQKKALALAESFGMKLGQPIDIQDNSNEHRPRPMEARMANVASLSMALPDTKPEDVEYTKNIRIVFEME